LKRGEYGQTGFISRKDTRDGHKELQLDLLLGM
jgi:hypothetical protein